MFLYVKSIEIVEHYEDAYRKTITEVGEEKEENGSFIGNNKIKRQRQRSKSA